MTGDHSSPQTRRFGLFEVDLAARELRRKGVRVKLQHQPFELLLVLVENPGKVVTREALRQRLWPADVYVDFDRSLNKAIVKLREALGDSSDSPLYVETLPRVGYRFIGMLNDAAETSPAANVSSQLPDLVAAPDSQASPVQPPAAPATLSAALPAPAWRKNSRLLLLSLAALLLIAATSGVWAVRRPKISAQPIHSLAVLPLDNLSGDPAQDYLADGMTDELTTMVAKNSTLNVVSRTSVMQFKGAHRPLPEIARALGVDAILEGSLARSGDKVHMTIQLIQASTDTHLWAESYDSDTKDSVALPSQAAQSIAKRLNAAVLHPPSARYVSPEAHDAYLRGRYILFVGSDEEAEPFFRKATALQPDYALGWSGLADYYGVSLIGGEMAPAVGLPQLKAAALKAVELDDSLAQAHLSLAAALFLTDWSWDRAEQEIHRALELDPKCAECLHLHAKMLTALNRYPEAVAEQKLATELDPFSRPYSMAQTYLTTRQCDAAINDARQNLKSFDSGDLHWILSEAYRCKGMDREAVAQSERALSIWGATELSKNVQVAFARGGYRAVLRCRISDQKKRAAKVYTSPMKLATWYAQLGDREETIRLLQQAYQEHSALLPWLQTDTAFDFLHSDERYRAIVKDLGLPPAY